MKKIELIIRPEKLEPLKKILSKNEYSGLTVILDEDLDDILTEICEKLSTGQVGDGKIFITNVDDVMRIRTGEHGESIL